MESYENQGQNDAWIYLDRVLSDGTIAGHGLGQVDNSIPLKEKGDLDSRRMQWLIQPSIQVHEGP